MSNATETKTEIALAVTPVAVETTTQVQTVPVDPFFQELIEQVNAAVEDPNVQVTISKVTPLIPAKARNIIYVVGIVAGALGTAGTTVAAILTGDLQVLVGTGASIALALTNVLSKLNLSKTADDIAAEAAA